MKSTRQKLLVLGLVGILAFTLSGCMLQLMLGRVFVTSIGDEVQQIIAAVFSNTTTAVCREVAFTNEAGQRVTSVECTYIIQSEEFPFIPEQTSTAQLLSEFGILGVFIDPVILQVPENVSVITATFDNGSGAEALMVTEATSFRSDATTDVLPQSGHKFVILEFPDAELSNITATDPAVGHLYSFYVEFDLPALAPLEIKPMFAGKVELLSGETFYPPMLPCTTDFTSIPAVTIPVSEEFVDLSLDLALPLVLGQVSPCDGQVYDFTGVDGGSPAISPAISIEKSPDQQTVSTGSDAVFQIRLENTGDVPLTGIAVVDAQTPDCDRVIGTLEPGEEETYQCTAPGVTADFVNIAQVSATPPGGPEGSVTHQDTASVTVVASRPPDCSAAAPSPGILWPPDHRFVAISIQGVTDPDGDAVSINIDAIRQDEPVDSTGDGKFVPDGKGVGTATADLRAERVGGSGRDRGNGRVYHVYYTASDGIGNACSGKVLVGVPHDMGQGKVPVDDGPLYDSTQG